jgi:hypothetical protein
MNVTVIPDTFTYVEFDAALITRVAAELSASMGLGRDVRIEVDETTPLAKILVEVPAAAGDPIVVRADSGAFEDTRKPRHQSEHATATSLGRVLHRANDRLSGGFGEAPPDGELTLAQMAAWETYSVGRLDRLGITANRQRWLYNFRNRHGFTDAGDGSFEQLWSSDGLTWGELQAISDEAISFATTAEPASVHS